MAEGNRKVVVEIDEHMYKKILECSRVTKQSEQFIVNKIFKYSLRDFEKNIKNLKQGYIDMGKINLEISNAFILSENEASNRINKHKED